MPLMINTNVASLNAQRSLTKNANNLQTSFQRLSSGLRINSAKDDAAGLAIAQRFTSQVRGLNQAIRNANDGVSLAQTTESALNEVGGNLQRLRELAVQSANDTNSSSDRAAIQAEADQLVAEIDRIATQTTFNGRNVLDGSFNNAKFQIGANQGDTITVSLQSSRSFNLGAVASQQFSAAATNAALAEGDLTINGEAIRASSANDDQLSFSARDQSAIAKAAAINSSAADTGVTASVDANVYNAGAVVADTDTDGLTGTELVINGISIDTAGVQVQAADADSTLRNAINAVQDQTGVSASLDGSSNLILTAADGRNITIGATDGTIAGSDGVTAVSTVSLEADEAFTVAAGTNRAGGYANFTQVAEGSFAVSTTTNLDLMTLATQNGANDAIATLDTAIRQVSSKQADLGALLSRFESTVSSLSAVSENLSAARSRIQDADFAAETAKFSKNQILQQASTSILAQANVSTQVALSLLG